MVAPDGPPWPPALRALAGRGRAGSAICRPPASTATMTEAGCSRPAPSTPCPSKAPRRAGAEHDWLGLAGERDLPLAIFRLPGIYGPGRSPFDRLRAGTAHRWVKPGQVFSRVHVDDLVAGLQASMAQPRAGGIYHLCDDEPAPAHEVKRRPSPPSCWAFGGAARAALLPGRRRHAGPAPLLPGEQARLQRPAGQGRTGLAAGLSKL